MPHTRNERKSTRLVCVSKYRNNQPESYYVFSIKSRFVYAADYYVCMCMICSYVALLINKENSFEISVFDAI